MVVPQPSELTWEPAASAEGWLRAAMSTWRLSPDGRCQEPSIASPGAASSFLHSDL